ncbi:PucR family transcriptional regulator [Streptomyces sp. NPDC059534]|uniref:PucR family transcriptional regulator n=1 Tax=Streptomyces sp. NPDC059534 TaxID=3346859 RepID=UPI003680AFFC
MEALAERLSQLDPHSEGALRVVAFYDTLMRRRVDLPALARASAGLAECVAGIRLHGTGRSIRVTPDGREAAAPTAVASATAAITRPPTASAPALITPPPAASAAAPTTPPTAPTAPSTTAPITLDDEEIGTVWLERPGPPGVFDDVLLDRLAIAAAAVVERYGPARTTMADPALVELVVSADCDEAGRARALRLLGFAADLPVRVVAVRSRIPLDRVGGLICPARPVKAALVGGVGVILATTVAPDALPAGVRAGIGATGAPDRAWREARTALRFTTPRRPVVHHDDLGALALLADVPDDVLRANADVTAVAHLARTPEDIETLEAYCATGSLRRAADALHLHHSTVARRIDHIGTALHIDLTDPTGLTRARLALTAWQLLGEA